MKVATAPTQGLDFNDAARLSGEPRPVGQTGLTAIPGFRGNAYTCRWNAVRLAGRRWGQFDFANCSERLRSAFPNFQFPIHGILVRHGFDGRYCVAVQATRISFSVQ